MRAPLRELFTPDVLDRLANKSRPAPSKWDTEGECIRRRDLVLRTIGRPSSSPSRIALQRAWASYLRVADACGLLAIPDVRSRLVGSDDEGFRSVMAECCAAWYFARRRRARVIPNPASKATKNFDLVIERDGLTVHAEVKAPYVPRLNKGWAGDDSEVLSTAVKKAGEQFKRGHSNLVVLVPSLRTPISDERGQLLKALIGKQVLEVFVSLDGSKAPPPKPVFLQNGKLAKRWPDGEGAFRSHLTRVSAVMSIEHRREGARLVPAVVVVHNPFATSPLPREFFGKVPQWLVDGGTMRWSDRRARP